MNTDIVVTGCSGEKQETVMNPLIGELSLVFRYFNIIFK